MDYAQAREQIQSGDVIGVRDAHNILGRATQFFTHDPHTHTGVAQWLGGRLFMADLNSGRNHLTALSQLNHFDVYDPPAGLERPAIEVAAFDWLAKPISYGIAAFILIGLKCALHITAFIHWRKIVVCSGGTIEILERAAAIMLAQGKQPPAAWVEHNRMLSPGELVAELGPPKLRVGY